MRWLVDGYNVILSDPKLSRMLRNDNEQGRFEFIAELSASRRFSGENVTIVFDGRFTASSSREGRMILVRFTSRRESADDFIKKEIGNSPKRRSLTVVTNDRSIIAYAKECGAKTLGSRDFLTLARGNGRRREKVDAAAEKPESTGRPDPELLKLFTGRKK